MSVRATQWFSAPQFESDDKKRDSLLIHAFLMILLVSAGLYNVALLLSPTRNLSQLLVAWGATAVLLCILGALRKGHVRLSGYALPMLLWFILTAACWNRGGVTNTAFSGYLFIIIFATFLGGKRLGWVFVGISAANGLLMLWFHGTGWLVPVEISPLAIWARNMLFAVELVLLQGIARRYAESALRAVRENEAALKVMNHELKQQIIERKRAERDRDQILELSLDIIGVSSMDGYFKRLNPAAERILGYTTEELMHLPTTLLTHPDDMERSLEEAAKLEAGIPSIDFENRYVCKDGTIKWLSWRAYPADNLLYFVARDVTANKEAEAQRVEIEMEKRLVALKHEFISMVSHEFRNPLAVIQASKDILDRYAERLTPESRGEHLHTIEKQVNHMMSMLQEVLLINQFSNGVMQSEQEWVDIDRYFDNLVTQMQATANGTHRIRLDARDLLGEAMIDQRMMDHIFTNLIGNGVKYSPAGTEVVLEIEREGNMAVFRVRDLGIGIPEDALKRLYEPFFRASNARQISGTGLGLAIVKDCVEAHGGTIECDSRVGGGTTFTVRLPIVRVSSAITRL